MHERAIYLAYIRQRWAPAWLLHGIVKKAAGNFVCDLPDAFTVATPTGEEAGRLQACHGFILESQLTAGRSLLNSRLLFLAELLEARIAA